MITVIDLDERAMFRVTDSGDDVAATTVRAQIGDDVLDITMMREQAEALSSALASYLNKGKK